jgi:hypothetical protein
VGNSVGVSDRDGFGKPVGIFVGGSVVKRVGNSAGVSDRDGVGKSVEIFLGGSVGKR